METLGPMLHENKVRSIVRLLGEVAGSYDDHAARKRQLMSGLSRLVEADGWLWSVTRVRDERPVCCALLHGGLTDEQLTAWAESSQATDPPLPEHRACLEISQQQYHATRTREQMVPDADWYSNPTVRRYRLAVGIDDFLYSLYPLGEPYYVSAIGLYRRSGRPRFSVEDRRLTHIVLSEVPWLHTAGLPEQALAVPSLTPRQRTVFLLLLEGHDRKRIAQLLELKPYTVKDHIEAVYRHFDVSSQVDLMRRFALGNGGDVRA